MTNRSWKFAIASMTNRRAAFLLILFCICWSSVFAERRERSVESWKPLHYNVNLVLNDQLSEITRAQVDINVISLTDSLSQVDLDFGELTIEGVTVDNETVPFERSPGRLNVKLRKGAPKGTRLVVSVTYRGRPADGLILTIDKSGRPSAIGDNWPDRAHHWLPCLDHPSAKATINFTVTAPSRARVVANGKLDRVVNASNTTRRWSFTESVPIPPYCMIIAVGEFAKIDPPQQTVTPLSYYVPHSDRPFAMQGFAPADPSLKFFSETIAPYPYEKLALIVGATRFGGMENSGAIVFSNNVFGVRSGSQPISRVFKIRQGLVALVAHEIAHQWFGDSVTGATWADLWLSEGFATYFAALFLQKHDGDEAFREYMKESAENYFEFAKKRRIPIRDVETENLLGLLNANNYQKGAWVLHMLRSELGDDVFFRGVRLYYEAHKHSTASTEDLRSAFEKASGRDLKSFFARWVYGSGHPNYELTWQWIKKTNTIKLSLKQLQPEPAFQNAVEIDIQTSDGKRRIVMKPIDKQSSEEIKLRSAPLKISLDPDDYILDEASKIVGN